MQVGQVIWTHAVIQNDSFYGRIARAVLSDYQLYVATRIEQSKETGLLVARIVNVDLTGNRDVRYFFKKPFAGFPEQLDEQLYNAMTFKKTELELIARGDVL